MIAAIVDGLPDPVGPVTSTMRFFCFFQAEDGIRDLTVTGVQTCALPIFVQSLVLVIVVNWKATFYQGLTGLPVLAEIYISLFLTAMAGLMTGLTVSALAPNNEIGRASCRERV